MKYFGILLSFFLFVSSAIAANVTPQPVNIRSFGAIGDGTSHPLSSVYGSLAAAQAVYPFVSDLTQQIDWAAIQSAIDFCGNNSGSSTISCREIYCASGRYQLSLPIFLDLPHNLRGSNSNWASGTTYSSGQKVTYNGIPWSSLTNGNVGNTPAPGSTSWAISTSAITQQYWAPVLNGGEGLPGGAPGTGCMLFPTFNTDVVLWTYGNGVMVHGIDIRSPSPNVLTCQQPAGGVAIGMAGAGSRTRIENVGIAAFYTGIKTNADGNGTIDDQTFIEKSSITGQCVGVWFAGSQNFMNTLIDNVIHAHVNVLSVLNTGANIYGGNYAGYGSGGGETAQQNTFTVSGVVASTPNNTVQLAATINVPDSYLTNSQCVARNTAIGNGSLDGCIYNAFSVVTTHFGVVPLQLLSYSSGAAVFQVLPSYLWVNANQWGCCSTITTDLNAITTIYASELQTTFWGCGFTIDAVHIENPDIPTTFINSGCAFGNGRPNHIRQPYFNYDISIAANKSGNLPAFYAQQGFPFITQSNVTTDLVIEDVNWQTGGVTSDYVEVDVIGSGPISEGGPQFIWRGRAPLMNIRVSPGGQGGGAFSGNYAGINTLLGGILFDDGAAATATQSSAGMFSDVFRTTGWGRSPFWGMRPAPWSTPCLTPAQVTILANPIAGSALGGYPIMWGGQVYRKCDWTLSAQGTYNVVSSHTGYTYGTSLTTTNLPGLAYQLGNNSNVVYIQSAADLTVFFPGLVVVLNPGCGTKPLLITEVHKTLGYVIVVDATSDVSNRAINMPYGFACNGSVIAQQSYALTQF